MDAKWLLCRRCREDKPETEFHWREQGVKRHVVCKTCRATLQRENYDPESVRDKHLQRRYGINQEDYERIWKEQGEKCAICSKVPAEHHKNKFHVDHDHETGQIRGILCTTCNVALGKFGDGSELLEKAMLYLQRGNYRVGWDEYFLRLASQVATRSKDRSTQVGALIVKNRRVISTGYNGLPRGVNDSLPERHLRPVKYDYFEHAERNAIYNCVREEGLGVQGATMYVTLHPCCDCARGIIQSGIVRVVTREYFPSTWNRSMQVGIEMLEECGVELDYI